MKPWRLSDIRFKTGASTMLDTSGKSLSMMFFKQGGLDFDVLFTTSFGFSTATMQAFVRPLELQDVFFNKCARVVGTCSHITAVLLFFGSDIRNPGASNTKRAEAFELLDAAEKAERGDSEVEVD